MLPDSITLYIVSRQCALSIRVDQKLEQHRSPKKLLGTDPNSIDAQIRKLEVLSQKEQIRSDERRTVLRVFYGLCKDTRERNCTKSVNAKSRTAKLYGVSVSTVKRFVAAWNNVSRRENRNDEDYKKVNYKISGTGSATPHEKRAPNNSETFVLIRNFISSKRAQRARMCSPDVLQYFLQNQVIQRKRNSDSTYNARDYDAALGSVQRCLLKKKILQR